MLAIDSVQVIGIYFTVTMEQKDVYCAKNTVVLPDMSHNVFDKVYIRNLIFDFKKFQQD